MKISVIIPAYNAEKTIEKCIESVINQTYDNFEIIVINDGSKDKTLDVINKYKSKNIVIINQENIGVSRSRNNAIKIASGDFVLFLDSDDYIDCNMLENMVLKYRTCKCDLVVASLICEDNEKIVSKLAYDKETKNKIESINIMKNEKFISLLAGPTFKLFKRNILIKNNVYFIEDLSLGEDTCFVLEYFKYVTSISFINDSFYHAVIRKNSLSRINHDDIWKIQEKILEKFNDMLNISGIKENNYSEYSCFYFRSIRIAINYSIQYEWGKIDYYKLCDSIVNSIYFKYISKPSNKFQYIIYKCLKRKNFTCMFYIFKIKKMIKEVIKK